MQNIMVRELIDRARRENRATLSEVESKTVLSCFGIPVVCEAAARTEEQAAAEALKMGFPVVVKGLGANLTHKTERGLVLVNLCAADDVRRAFREIRDAAGADWEACLVQPQIKGRRELVCGMFRDAQFGPCVMFGLGGVLAEALNDVTFRIAPVDQDQAREMQKEIRAAKLLGAFRGEAAADAEQLAFVLAGLSRLALTYPEIKEVDINPLIVMPDGGIKAVDALVVLGDPAPFAPESREDALRIRKALDVMANAESVAVVGATSAVRGGFLGIFGCMRHFGYQGRLYPINPKAEIIDGLKAYPNLASLPEKVDLVILAVPARAVPDALKDCIASGNHNVHIFTAGFKETEEEGGAKLQEVIETIAVAGGLHVVGPNCMGWYVPSRKMLTWNAAPAPAGPVSMISQSGGNAQEFTHHAARAHRIFFNKVVSYGNGLTLDSTDYLDYLAHDDSTSLVTMYVEGVKDGRRFLEVMQDAARRKPVILMKGGMTESGARAASSHTGAMAGARLVWEAFFRQSGAVRAESLEEMADITAAFHYLKATRGRRIGVVSVGGGQAVAVADICAQAGMELPAFSPATVEKIRAFIPPEGNMIRNPIDSYLAFMRQEYVGKIFDILAQSGEVDNIVVSLPLDWLYREEAQGNFIELVAHYLAGEGRTRLCGLPLMVAWRQYQDSEDFRKMRVRMEDILLTAGVPVYEGLNRAVRALAKVERYSAFLRAAQT
ncbi:MAG: acetate--CoA ligase family protein [Deltaproteobacteria bacterium]